MCKTTKTTIRDVAKYAKVSVATVSHVINNSRPVSEHMRARVGDAIEKLGYVPDSHARSLRTGEKKIIAFIVPDISNKFFATLIDEVESYVSTQQYSLIIANTKENKKREKAHIEYLSSGVVDGILIASTMENSEEFSNIVIPPSIPIVFVDRIFEDMNYDMLTISSYHAIYKSVENMIIKGHKKIGFISGLPHLSSAKERIRAYLSAMEDNGIEVTPNLVQYSDRLSSKAAPCVANLLKAGCTAMIISNGMMAADTLYFLKDNNIEIGKDVSLICFSDFDSPIFSSAPIDLIEQPVKELGRQAGEQIIRRIKEPDAPLKNIILNSTYKVR